MRLGILPTGTCNDLAHALDLPTATDEALRELLASRQTRLLDLGHVHDQDGRVAYFATIATLGFDSAVSEFVASGRPASLFRGRAAYL